MKNRIVQIWDNHNQLGMIIYEPQANGRYAFGFHANVGVNELIFRNYTWLPVSMNGDGKTQIVQLWDDSNQLGMVVYQPQPDGSYAVWTQTPKIGENELIFGNYKWLPVSMNGDGKTQIVQLWNDSGQLGMVVYQPHADGKYTVGFHTQNIRQGFGAVAWLPVSMNGDGKTQIVQLWDNHGQLGMIVYQPHPDGSYAAMFENPNMRQGSGAVAWLPVSMNGDGTTQIVQLWDNHGQLGMIVYQPHPDNSSYSVWTETPNMRQGSGAVAWLPVSMKGDGTTQIVQLWDNHGKLGMIVYRPHPDTGSYTVWTETPNMGQGSGALAWLPVSMKGDGTTQIVQLWDNHGQLGMIVYQPHPDTGLYTVWADEPNMGQGSGALAWLLC